MRTTCVRVALCLHGLDAAEAEREKEVPIMVNKSFNMAIIPAGGFALTLIASTLAPSLLDQLTSVDITIVDGVEVANPTNKKGLAKAGSQILSQG